MQISFSIDFCRTFKLFMLEAASKSKVRGDAKLGGNRTTTHGV